MTLYAYPTGIGVGLQVQLLLIAFDSKHMNTQAYIVHFCIICDRLYDKDTIARVLSYRPGYRALGSYRPSLRSGRYEPSGSITRSI